MVNPVIFMFINRKLNIFKSPFLIDLIHSDRSFSVFATKYNMY